MGLFQLKYIFYLIAFTLIAGVGIGMLLLHALPNYYPHWYIPMLSFFFLIELATVYAVDNGIKKSNQRKLINIYLLIGVVKFFLSLIFIATYAIVVKDEKRNFGIVFILLYFLYILFDLFYYSRIEQKLKKINTTDK